MVELQPISTGTQSNSTTSSSNNSISSSSSCSSPTQPSPISLLPPPNFPIMRPPLLPHHPYSPSPLNPPSPYPLNHPHPHQAVYIQFPQQPYLVHPYFDHFCYYTNPLPPDYLPAHQHQPHADQYHFYPQPWTPPAGGPQHGVAVAYSSGGDGGGCDGGAEEVVDPALDHHYGGDRRLGGMWGKRVSRRFTSSGPRHFHGGQSNFGRCRVKKTWKPKEASSNSVASPSPASPMNCTTLMIKNIPNRISRRTLINLLESHCRDQNEIAEQQTQPCRSEFDFLYLPFDFKRWRNLGYAFVNFTTVEGASRLYSCWNGIGWDGCPKIREITRARLQGKERCKKHFQISVFKCRSEEYLPVVFSPPRDGWNSRVAKMTNIGTRIDR